MRSLLLLTAAIAATAAEFSHNKVTSEISFDPDYELLRQRRYMWPFHSDPNEYSCQITPYVTFSPAPIHSEPMPAYLCTNGNTEVLIATKSFFLRNRPYEYATYAKLNIDPGILHIEYPGSFTETPPSLVYKHSKGNAESPTVEVTGLLLLTDGGIQRQSHFLQFLHPTLYKCEFVPFVNFFNEHTGELPVFRCIRGWTEILIASESFHSPYDQYQVSQNLQLDIGEDIRSVYYPGSFLPVPTNKFRGNPNLTHKGGEFFVQGLLRLTE